MGYVKYTKEQLAERECAQVAINAARVHLKSLREAKKAKKELIADVRRTAKARIRRMKEAEVEGKRKARAETALKKKCKPLLVVLRKVYKPYLVARRKLNRLRVAKRKAELAADRKLARETAKAAKELLKKMAESTENSAKKAELRAEEPVNKSPKKQLKINTNVKSKNTDPPKHLIPMKA